MREMNRQLDDDETSDIANKIDALEAERDRLLSELSNRVTASLDPRSELSNLLSQLKSSDAETRKKAVQGLLALKDPLSFIPLVNYLENKTDEATKNTNVYIGEWFRTLIQIGGPKGAEYVASQIESPREGWPEAVFSNLHYALSTPELIDSAIPAIERCALSHPSTSVRTQAKVLIQHLQSSREEYVKRANTQKEHEKWMEEQENEQEKRKIPSDFIMISALKDNDLDQLAYNIIHSGQDPKFWRFGFIIAEEYAHNAGNQKNCIQAIKQILEHAKNEIAKSSHCFLLYLLSEMEASSGDSQAAKAHLEEAHELMPALLQFLKEHERTFHIRAFA
jgi:hypothetical protein